MAIDIIGHPSAMSDLSDNCRQSVTGGMDDTESMSSDQISRQKDEVKIMRDSDFMKFLEAHIGKRDDIDLDRISRLKFEIENGQYNIDIDRVAEKFIYFESKLGY